MKNNDNNLLFLGEAKIYSLSRIKGGGKGLLMQNFFQVLRISKLFL